VLITNSSQNEAKSAQDLTKRCREVHDPVLLEAIRQEKKAAAGNPSYLET
jgi:hypothetical protein